MCVIVTGKMLIWSCVFFKGMTIGDVEVKMLTILKQVMEEKLTATNVSVRRLFIYLFILSVSNNTPYTTSDGQSDNKRQEV